MKINADTKTLIRTVKKLTGRSDVVLTIEESKDIRANDPANFAVYQALRKEHNAAAKALLSKLAKSKTVPYPKAYKALVDAGFTRTLVPGFTGDIDATGKLYFEGKLLNATPNVATYSEIVMNEGDKNYICTAVKHGGGVAHIYTMDFMKARSKAKFEKVSNTAAVIDKIRKKWLTKIKAFDLESPASVAALVLEMLFKFAARVGSEPGRGLGMIQRKQVKVTPTTITISYLGKDSIPTKHKITKATAEDRLLYSALVQLVDAAETPNSHLFSVHRDGKATKVMPVSVNKAFKFFGAPSGVTVHKLRTIRGTTLFQHLVAADEVLPLPKNKKEALLRYKAIIEDVGDLLNHRRGVGTDKETVTGATAAKSYIDLEPQLALFKRWGFDPPSLIANLR